MSRCRIPGTLEVSAVWTVGGGAAGAGVACCVGALAGCTEPITDLGATPGVDIGVNPMAPAPGATAWGIIGLRFCPTCEGPGGTYEFGAGGTGYALLDGPWWHIC